jgi:hypothetical protein
MEAQIAERARFLSARYATATLLQRNGVTARIAESWLRRSENCDDGDHEREHSPPTDSGHRVMPRCP